MSSDVVETDAGGVRVIVALASFFLGGGLITLVIGNTSLGGVISHSYVLFVMAMIVVTMLSAAISYICTTIIMAAYRQYRKVFPYKPDTAHSLSSD